MKKHIFLLLLALTFLNCTNSHTTEPNDPEIAPIDRAYNQLKEIESQGYDLVFVSPRFWANGEFSHLLVSAKKENALRSKFAIDQKGQVVSVSDAKKAFGAKHHKLYGNLSEIAAVTYEQLKTNTDARAVIWLPNKPNSETLNTIQTILAPHNIQTSKSGLHFISVPSIDKDSIAKLMHQKLAATVDLFVDGTVVSDSNVGGASRHSRTFGTYNSFNQGCNFYGTGVKVGLMEDLDSETTCISGLYENHESISNTNVSYMYPPTPCFNVSECRGATIGCNGALSGDDEYACVGGQCVHVHANEVASRISAYNTNGAEPDWHANQVDILFANKPINFFDPVDLTDTLDNFLANNTKIINESFSINGVHNDPSPHTLHAAVTDWYARNHDMIFVKSSGNKTNMQCYGLNKICVGGIDAAGTYGEDYMDDFLALDPMNNNQPLSGYLPPAIIGPGTQITAKDIYRPDVVSEGWNAPVMDVKGSTSDWTTNSGTSFSAPVVTGLLALHAESNANQIMTPLYARTLVRFGANWNHNLLDGKDVTYPTRFFPKSSTKIINRSAGLGIIDGNITCKLSSSECCSSEGENAPDIFEGEGTLNFAETEWEPMPSYAQGPPIQNGYTTYDDLDDNSFPNSFKVAYQDLKANTKRLALVNVGANIDQLDRVRFHLSFYSCTAPPTVNFSFFNQNTSIEQVKTYRSTYGAGTPTGQNIPVDMDLIMCSDSAEQCWAQSFTYEDSNEGFDYFFETPPPEDTTIYLVAPEDAQPCPGYENEPYRFVGQRW